MRVCLPTWRALTLHAPSTPLYEAFSACTRPLPLSPTHKFESGCRISTSPGSAGPPRSGRRHAPLGPCKPLKKFPTIWPSRFGDINIGCLAPCFDHPTAPFPNSSCVDSGESLHSVSGASLSCTPIAVAWSVKASAAHTAMWQPATAPACCQRSFFQLQLPKSFYVPS